MNKGTLLYLDTQDYGRFDLAWLPGGLRASPKFEKVLKPAPRHPLFEGLPDRLERGRIVTGTFQADEGWTLLGEPAALAVRQHGKGWIVVSQIQQFERPFGATPPAVFEALTRLMSNMLALAGPEAADRPVLVLDEGEGTILDILSSVNQRAAVCRESGK